MSGNNIIGLLFGVLLVFRPVMAVSAEQSQCLSPEARDSASSRETNSKYFGQQFAVAEQLRQSAANAGAEWLKTEELLNQSKEEATNDNWNLAFSLVLKACQQAELALQQAEYESEAWKHRVVE